MRLSILLRYAFVAILTVVFYINRVWAQDYDIKYIGIPEGLSQGMVTSMCQDKDGFIWIGTLSGLNRYDGYRFKTFTHHLSDPHSLANNSIIGLFEDSKGRIWVGTPEGIDIYDRNTGQFLHLGAVFNADNKRAENITPVFESADGHIWMISAMMVVEMIVPDSFPADLLSQGKIKYNIFEAGKGLPQISLFNLYLNKLYHDRVGINLPDESGFIYNPKNQSWQKASKELNPNKPEDYAKEMIYDAFRNGHWTLNNQTLQFVSKGSVQQKLSLARLNIPCSKSHINSKLFYADKQGVLWLLVDHLNIRRLYRILPPDITQGQGVKVEQPLHTNDRTTECKELLIDRQGTIWLGTTGYGLIQIIPKTTYFNNYYPAKSIGVISPIPDRDSFWARNGPYMFEFQMTDLGKEVLQTVRVGGVVYPANNKLALTNGTVVSRYSTSNDDCFLQVELPNGKQHHYPIPINYHTDAIFEDRDQRLWLSSSYGSIVCMMPPYDSLITYSYLPVFENNEGEIYIKQLYQSQNGMIWMATQHGLIQIEAPANKSPRFKLFKSDPGNLNLLSSNAIMSVLDDPAEPDRYLWVATNGNGLNRMDKLTGNCRHYTKKNGLPDNVVYGILADTLGRLWLSTNFGLSCFNPQTEYFLNFTANDGLQDNEFNGQSFYKDAKGFMYFGGVKGFSVFNPNNIIPSKNFAPVFFTELKINNQITELRDSLNILRQPLEITKELRLKHNQNFITITYSALDFEQKANTRFYYKLNGVDNDWVFANNRTELSYPNLSPGTYTLQVTNLNQSGERNPQMASLVFVIDPPWWLSWAAYTIYAILIGAAVFGAFRFQANRIKLQNELLFKQKEAQNLQALDELKTRFFTNITHEFRTPLTIVIEPLNQLLQQDDTKHLKPQLQLIYNNAGKLLDLVNQLLDLSKLEHGTLQTNWVEGDLILIVREIFDYFKPVAAKKQQTLIWQSELGELNGMTDRQMLEKITYNLLSNAHKFTQTGGNIALNIAQKNKDKWVLTVQDNGIGIETDKLPFIFDRFYQTDNSLTRRSEGTGIGLSLVKELCQLLEAQIEVVSTPGEGTVFSLTFPIKPYGATATGNINPYASKLAEYIPIETSPEVMNNTNFNNVSEDSETTSILLVEDNADMRQYLKIVLTQNGYAVSEAENGKLGMEAALQTMPDLIITDVMMPEMDGYQLTETLKTNPITSHIPIVILTAKGRTESKIEGYRRGADAYLPKPFSTEELLVRIRQILTTRLALQQKYAQRVMPIENTNTPPESHTPDDQTETPLSDIDHQWLNDLYHTIVQNLSDENFVVDSLVPIFTMNRTQFYAKVKALTGQTPARLLRDARLEKAYQLLSSKPDLHYKDVVLQVGLNDAKNFALIFKERFDISPQQLQKKHFPN